MSETSLIDVGKLAEPATKLIEKLADGIGMLYQPRHLKKMARAELEIERMKLQEMAKTEIARRSINRLLYEEIRNQENMDEVVTKALPMLENDADPSGIDDDLLAAIMNQVKLVSDDDMQTLWARILAGEANSPGSFSKRTINLVSSLSMEEALSFTKVCRFWCGGASVYVYNIEDEVYAKIGLTYGDLAHLDSIGLVRFDGLSSFSFKYSEKPVVVDYHKTRLEVHSRDWKLPYDFQVGEVFLTKSGIQLAPICRAEPVEGFTRYLEIRWRAQGMEVKTTEI